jgi:hypothetical protein
VERVELSPQQWPARASWELGRAVEPQFEGFSLQGDHDGFHAPGPLPPPPEDALAVVPGPPLRDGQLVARAARKRLIFRAGR